MPLPPQKTRLVRLKIPQYFLLAASIFALASCSNGAESSLGVSQILLGGQVNARDEIEQSQTEFPPEQTMIHAHAFVTGLSASTLVRAEWWFDSDEAPKKIYETSVTLTPDRPVAKFSLQSTKQWPVGDYRFLLFSAEDQIGETEFEVTEE